MCEEKKVGWDRLWWRWVGVLCVLGVCGWMGACVTNPSNNPSEQQDTDGGGTGGSFTGTWKGLPSVVDVGGAERGFSEIRSLVATKQGHYALVVPTGILNPSYRLLFYASNQTAPTVIPTPVDKEQISYVGPPDVAKDTDDTILYAFPLPELRVFLFAKGAFTQLPKIPAKTFFYPKFTIRDGVVYAFGVGEGGKPYVYRYDGTMWRMLGDAPLSYTLPQPVQSTLEVASDKVYLFNTFASTSGDTRFFFRLSVWDGSAWKEIAVPGITSQMDGSLTTFDLSMDPQGTQLALVQTSYLTGETQIKRYAFASSQWTVTTLVGKNDSQHTTFHRYLAFDPDTRNRFSILKMRQPNNIPQNQVLEEIVLWDGDKKTNAKVTSTDPDILLDPLFFVWYVPTGERWLFGFNYGARPNVARCLQFVKNP